LIVPDELDRAGLQTVRGFWPKVFSSINWLNT